MKTFSPTPKDVDRKWYVVDATDQVLGRLASQIAHRLRGKHKPEYAPYIDNGDFIIVINCDKIKVTGTKPLKKLYYHHSDWMGGMKILKMGHILEKNPERIIRLAVRGMLPRSTMGHRMLTKLKLYSGPEHPHAAQNPQPLTLPY